MSTQTKIVMATSLIALGVVGRLMPHLWNFTPIAALALISGVYLGSKYAYLVPLTALLISDFFIGFYDFTLMLFVYGGFLLAGGIAYLIRKHKSMVTFMAGSLIASTLFYLITNWAVWYLSPWYEKTFEGLMLSYTLALPFFRNALVGDLFYTLALFGAFEFALYMYHTGILSLRVPSVIHRSHF